MTKKRLHVAARVAGKSLILIGMPGAGKSTVGVLLAKELAKDFADLDVLIQIREGKALQDILDQSDYLSLRRIEELTMLETNLLNHIIATGGSAVYSEKGMQWLKKFGPAVFLQVDADELKKRIFNYESRGIARRKDQSFDELFRERQLLYQKYADIVVDCNGKTQEAIIAEIIVKLEFV